MIHSDKEIKDKIELRESFDTAYSVTTPADNTPHRKAEHTQLEKPAQEPVSQAHLSESPLAATPETAWQRLRKLALSPLWLIGTVILFILPAGLFKRSRWLLGAGGYDRDRSLKVYTGITTLTACFAAFLGITAAAGREDALLYGLPPFVLGWLLPNFFLARQASGRQFQILREMPRIINSLVTAGADGVDLIGALRIASQKNRTSCPNLAREIEFLLSESQGKREKLPEELRRLAQAHDFEQLTSLSQILSAACVNGVVPSYALKQQVGLIEEKTRQQLQSNPNLRGLRFVALFTDIGIMLGFAKLLSVPIWLYPLFFAVYCGSFDSSRLMGTPGKLIFGLKSVKITLAGSHIEVHPVSFSVAFTRSLCQTLFFVTYSAIAVLITLTLQTALFPFCLTNPTNILVCLPMVLLIMSAFTGWILPELSTRLFFDDLFQQNVVKTNRWLLHKMSPEAECTEAVASSQRANSRNLKRKQLRYLLPHLAIAVLLAASFWNGFDLHPEFSDNETRPFPVPPDVMAEQTGYQVVAKRDITYSQPIQMDAVELRPVDRSKAGEDIIGSTEFIKDRKAFALIQEGEPIRTQDVVKPERLGGIDASDIHVPNMTGNVLVIKRDMPAGSQIIDSDLEPRQLKVVDTPMSAVEDSRTATKYAARRELKSGQILTYDMLGKWQEVDY